MLHWIITGWRDEQKRKEGRSHKERADSDSLISDVQVMTKRLRIDCEAKSLRLPLQVVYEQP